LADSLDASLLGAWTTSQADCSKLFVRKGGALSYRQPVDKFAQAEISFVAARATKHSPLNLPRAVLVFGGALLNERSNRRRA